MMWYLLRLIKKPATKNSSFNKLDPNPQQVGQCNFNVGNSSPVSLMEYVAIENLENSKRISSFTTW